MFNFRIPSSSIFSFCSLLLFFTIKTNAHELNQAQLDSLYNRFLSYKNINQGEMQIFSGGNDSSYEKCGFGLVSQVKFNFERFSDPQKKILLKLLQRPQTSDSIVSPSGYFRIHFNRNGSDAPNYDASLTAEENAMQVALAADSSYNFEVNYLGYPPPPGEKGDGTDNLYDIYISSIRDYGFTQPEDSIGNQKYSSYIVIHYDYKQNFYTKGLDAMDVTIAHEMHHAIQLGNYTADRISSDLFFYELTSTSMEEFVFDTVNDYYQYLPSYFRNTGLSFSSNSGYNIVIWNLYLKDIFGFDIIKREWELLPQFRAMDAIRNSIFERGSSFQKEFNRFGIWTYFTKSRFEKGAQQGFVFEEGNEYPLVNFSFQQSFTPPSDSYILNYFPVSNNFVRVLNGTDTIVIVITNSNIELGENNPNQSSQVSYGLYDHFIDLGKPISNLYLKNENPDLFWTTSEILNDSVSTNQIQTDKSISSVFPLPFFYEKNENGIRFTVKNPKDLSVEFYVYTIGMELVYSGTKILDPLIEAGSYVVSWNPADNKNKRLASGIYIYIIKSGDNIQKGKFIVFNR